MRGWLQENNRKIPEKTNLSCLFISMCSRVSVTDWNRRQTRNNLSIESWWVVSLSIKFSFFFFFSLVWPMPSLLSLLCSMNIAKSIVFPAVFSCHSHCSPWLLFSGTFVSSAWMKFGEECARERELLMGTRSDGFFLLARWIPDFDCRRRSSFSPWMCALKIDLVERVLSVPSHPFASGSRDVDTCLWLSLPHFSNRPLERKCADETVGHCSLSGNLIQSDSE